jgi:uroporphyrin-3 C-methyltransferase
MESTPTPRAAPGPRRAAWLLALLVPAVALVAMGALAWRQFEAARQAQARSAAADRQRLEALEDRIDALRRDVRAHAARIQQGEATHRLLREEVIGLGQRAALLEESVRRLANPELDAARALRLDEVELLLAQGQQRLLLSGDLEGARRAYALAARLLDGIPDPGWVDVRQALAQERAALDALGDDPRAAAAGRLDAVAAALPSLPREPAAAPAAASWWERAMGRLVEVRPSTGALAADPADRAAGLAALQLELTLAQGAIARGDREDLGAALGRIDAWLVRLWPASPARERQRGTLRALRDQPLAPELPTLGSTLEQLRRQRGPG